MCDQLDEILVSSFGFCSCDMQKFWEASDPRGHRHLKKICGVVFFFNASLTELTDYIIRHISKYSNIMSSLSSNSAGFCPKSASQKPQGLCAVGFLHQSCFGPIEKGKQKIHFSSFSRSCLVFPTVLLFKLFFSQGWQAQPCHNVCVPLICSVYPLVSRTGWIFG